MLLLLGMLYSIIIYPIAYILPAYVANGAPVVFGGGKPLDFGKSINGKRIFGNNKTIRGLAAGIISGTIIGAFELPFFSYMLATAFVLSIGAMAGDLIGSFAKRSAGIKPGSSVPVLDQYGFLVAALACAWPLGNLPSIYGLVFIFAITGVLHLFTNKAAYAMKLKKVPW